MKTELQEYRFAVAMDVRTYGTATVMATSIEDARSKITAERVRDTFEVHGGGSDDYDMNHPLGIYLDGSAVDGNGEDCDIGEMDVPDGPWINDSKHKFVDKMAQFTTPEEEFADLEPEDAAEFGSVERYCHEMDCERLGAEYATFMEMVREARQLRDSGKVPDIEALTTSQIAAMSEDEQEDLLAAILKIEDQGDLSDGLARHKLWLNANGKAVQS